MSNKPIIIANWKMKLSTKEAVDLVKQIKAKVGKNNNVIVCPSFISINEVAKNLGKEIGLGAQDCFWEGVGSFTGEVSVNQLTEAGCQYVIVGHSERRKYLNETDEMVHNKTKMAISAGLIPIVCVGETFEQRQTGGQDYVIINQVTKALEGIEIKNDQSVIIAYEPVWVIGTGQAISPAEASHTHDVIRQVLIDLYGSQLVNNNFKIIYGGSVDQHNVNSFTALENIHGVLVGIASLKAEDFLPLIQNA